jgi:SAM-dependent methyltransferase
MRPRRGFPPQSRPGCGHERAASIVASEPSPVGSGVREVAVDGGGRSINVRYRILYLLGITPWERAEVPPQLQRFAAEWSQPGRALDVGCGTGRDAVYLAQHGWTVSAIDSVPQALGAAHRRARQAGVEVNWVQGDVTRLQESGVGAAFDLVLDRGCFHGLGDEARERCASGIFDVAAQGAQLLLFAFAPGRHGPAPRGISAEQLMRCFGERWELVSSEPDPDARLPRWLRNADPTWHRLRKRG